MDLFVMERNDTEKLEKVGVIDYKTKLPTIKLNQKLLVEAQK